MRAAGGAGRGASEFATGRRMTRLSGTLSGKFSGKLFGMTGKTEFHKQVKIVEVGLRDGLQNEKVVVSRALRLTLAEKLAEAGIKQIELGAFVSPQWVPQMAGSRELLAEALSSQNPRRLPKTAQSALAQVDISALVPNPRGMEEAIAVGLSHVAIFASASEAFSRKNINCSIDDSFVRFKTVLEMARERSIRVRGYLSMCFGCPFEGEVSEARVLELVKRLIDLGVYEVSIGDTIGVATPVQVQSLVNRLREAVGVAPVAMHFHDTRGTALANILASVELGVRVFDSSIGGLGGCPYAPAATGNVATEDVVYMLHGMGFDTGIDLQKLVDLNSWLSQMIGHDLPSRVGKAGIPRRIGPIAASATDSGGERV